MRKSILPLLQERLKNLSQPHLENYIRRVVNIEDITPVNDSLSMLQAKNILDFLLSQENIVKLQPTNLYALVERIISDGKLMSKENDGGQGFSQMIEKHRIEPLINQVLNKITRENSQLTEQFVESMLYTSMNLAETPNYFLRTVKNVILNGMHPAKKQGEAEEATQKDDPNYISTNQYLIALSAYRLFEGPLTAQMQNKLISYIKDPHFSVKRIQREVASERGGVLTRDHSDYDTLVIRGLRIA